MRWNPEAARSLFTSSGKKSSSHVCRLGINPAQKIERPPKFNCGFSPIKNSPFSEASFGCENVRQPNLRETLRFGNRQMLYTCVG